jgi:hypothetical protein
MNHTAHTPSGHTGGDNTSRNNTGSNSTRGGGCVDTVPGPATPAPARRGCRGRRARTRAAGARPTAPVTAPVRAPVRAPVSAPGVGVVRVAVRCVVLAGAVAVVLLLTAADAAADPRLPAVPAVWVRSVVLAQGGPVAGPSLDGVLTNIRNWIMGILALLATTYLTIGGVRYVLSAGEPGEVDAAKRCFRSAAFGYALAALAPVLVQILRGIVGA